MSKPKYESARIYKFFGLRWVMCPKGHEAFVAEKDKFYLARKSVRGRRGNDG